MAKKLVRGDFKHNRVKDPTAKLDPKHERTVKKFVKEYLDRAVQKKEVRDKEKAARAAKLKAEGKAPVDSPDTPAASKDSDVKENDDDEEFGGLSGDDEESPASAPGSDLKRKRQGAVDSAPSSPKKTRTEMPVPPPPPPPPAGDDAIMDGDSVDSAKAASPMHLETPPTSRSCDSDRGEQNGMEHSKPPQLALVNGGS